MHFCYEPRANNRRQNHHGNIFYFPYRSAGGNFLRGNLFNISTGISEFYGSGGTDNPSGFGGKSGRLRHRVAAGMGHGQNHTYIRGNRANGNIIRGDYYQGYKYARRFDIIDCNGGGFGAGLAEIYEHAFIERKPCGDGIDI